MDYLLNHKFDLISIATLLTTSYLIYKRKTRTNIELKNLKCERLDGKIVLVTGSNIGIGYETALDLAKRGATIILACRDLNKALDAQLLIKTKSNNDRVFVELLDLSSFESIKKFVNIIASKYDCVDILINNAGLMSCPKWTTSDGFEQQFQVNYLGHYLLTRLLLDKLLKSKEGRIINLTSKLYETGSINWDDINMDKDYNPLKSYKRSKLCNILFTNELHDYFEENSINNIQVYSVSPGVVLTSLSRYFLINKPWFYRLFSFLFYPIIWFMFKTPKQGAECTIYCAIKPGLKPTKGFYFRDCKELMLHAHAFNKNDSKRLWDLSENFVKNWL